jgi:membrane protein implicated in regulation of membrane protease activity
MVEVLWVLSAPVVVSLCVIAAYLVGFLVLSVVTVCRRGRPSPLSEELDQVLDEILGRTGAVRHTLQRSHEGLSR